VSTHADAVTTPKGSGRLASPGRRDGQCNQGFALAALVSPQLGTQHTEHPVLWGLVPRFTWYSFHPVLWAHSKPSIWLARCLAGCASFPWLPEGRPGRKVLLTAALARTLGSFGSRVTGWARPPGRAVGNHHLVAACEGEANMVRSAEQSWQRGPTRVSCVKPRAVLKLV